MTSFGKIARSGLGLAMAALFAGTAFADEAEKLTELSPDGKDACFGRVYDAAHMKAHPHQKVARIFFLYGHDPVVRPSEDPISTADTYSNGFITTTARGAKKPEWVSGSCGRYDAGDGTPSHIHCGMECDRTMANLKIDAKGRLSVNDFQPDVYLGGGAEEELGTAEFNKEVLGSEDDGFLLDPMPAATCQTEFARIDPVDPALGPPLRERLKPDQAFCYGRDYDAKHLASHPGQLTETVRVFRGPIELASFAADGKAEDWPSGADVTVAVTAHKKSGKVTQTYSCQGEGDQWRCAASAKMSDFTCDISQKEIFLRRGANGTMMLANPNSSLPLIDLCSKAADGKTRSDDKVFRLDPMPQEACGP